MQVSELMNRQIVAVSPEETAKQAAKLLSRHNVGSLPVCTPDGRLRGIVTDRDITLRVVAADGDADSTPVKEIMTRSMITASPDDDAGDAARKMAAGQIRRLPVVTSGRLVGMLSLGDLAKNRGCNMEAAAALTEICSGVRRK